MDDLAAVQQWITQRGRKFIAYKAEQQAAGGLMGYVLYDMSAGEHALIQRGEWSSVAYKEYYFDKDRKYIGRRAGMDLIREELKDLLNRE